MDVTKIISIIAIIVLVLNLVLASMRVYPFLVFWIIIIALCIIVYPLNAYIRKNYINGKNIGRKK